MSRFTIKLGNDQNRARLVLKDYDEPIGIITISWALYETMTRMLMMFILDKIQESIAETLGKRLWLDAQKESHDSAELAKQRLKDLGFNQEKINSYAEELARNAVQKLVGWLPSP